MLIAYVDESDFARSMPRTHAYSRIGKCCYSSCDWNTRDRKNVVAVLYNTAFHKSKKTQTLFESKGYIIEFLPPYSPDFNHIEGKCAQAKSTRRKLSCNVEEVF